ncbi:protein NEDD1-like [Aethina tumida]|uniref:protein NEDD1-like n=1 Tax=Aethina tumida TaxID=116153 RepID=UPI002147EA5E|nr:protein NEDD1-like [Aethina tumida]
MYIVSASHNLKVHEYHTGETLYRYHAKSPGSLNSISLSMDAHWLTVVPDSGFPEIVSVHDQFRPLFFIDNVEDVTCASFQNTRKKYLCLGTRKGSILLYDIKLKKIQKQFKSSSSVVTHVAFTAKDSHTIAACKNGDVLLFNNETNILSSTLKVPKSTAVNAICPNIQKRNLILGGSEAGIVVCWDIHSSRNKFVMAGHKAPITSLAFSPINADLVISAGLDRQFNMYDIKGSICITRVSAENNITAVDFSSDGQFFALGCQNGKIYVHDGRHMKKPIVVIQSHKEHSVKHLLFRKLRLSEKETVMKENMDEKNSVSDTPKVDRSEIKETKGDSFLDIHISSKIKAENSDSFVPNFGNSKGSDNNDKMVLGLGSSSSASNVIEVTGSDEKDLFMDALDLHQNVYMSQETQTEQPVKVTNGTQISVMLTNSPPKLDKETYIDSSLIAPCPIFKPDTDSATIRSIVEEIISEQLKLFKEDILEYCFQKKNDSIKMHLNILQMIYDLKINNEVTFNEILDRLGNTEILKKEISDLKTILMHFQMHLIPTKLQ